MNCALLDNDVLIKVSAYKLSGITLDRTTFEGVPPAMLGVGRFVVRDRLARSSRFADGAAALTCFNEMLPGLSLLEPTDAELQQAAEFESYALSTNSELDGGESQLLAILISRSAKLLATGDKRAIKAIEAIAAVEAQGRIACFEQLVASIALAISTNDLQSAICSEPNADKALSICFKCASQAPLTAAAVSEALNSYIEHVRLQASSVLIAGSDLTAFSA